jgi:ribose transport system permease protein
MNRRNSPFISQALLRGIPVLFLGVLLAVFGTLSSRFLTGPNLQAILIQSSWLIVVALGMNLVLLTAGVDLSVGVAMYLAAVAVGMGLADAPVWLGLVAAVSVGALFGAINGLVIVRLNVPAFIVTLATTFIGRGIGIFISSTKIVYASEPVAALGRASIGGIPVPVVFALAAILVSWVLLKVTPLGPYIRTIGADREGARRAGVPVASVTWAVYLLCGGFAGLGGFVSLSQTSAASAAFGQNAEFLAIAAAVLGGTSLFGGRGTLWAPIVGGILITIIQNGLVMIDANPYAYPVITGLVIFLAASLDSFRSWMTARSRRRHAAAAGASGPPGQG